MKSFIHRILKQNPDDNQQEKNPIAFLNLLSHILVHLNNKKLVIKIALALGLFLLTIIIFLIHHQTNTVSYWAANENKQARAILSQLSDMDTQLQQLSSHSQNSKAFKEMLLKLGGGISEMKKSVNDLAKARDMQRVSSQITSMRNDVDTQMLELKEVVANNSKAYLDSKVLPFQVISIDVMSQQPFVSINYDYHLTPLTVGDSLAGWQITAADYASAQVEFKNEHDQYVKVSLQG